MARPAPPADQRRVTAELCLVSGSAHFHQHEVIQLHENDRSFGRGPLCDISWESPQISRRHATLQYRRGKWLLLDTSTNGILVNGIKCVKQVPLELKEADLITFVPTREGRYRFRYVNANDAQRRINIEPPGPPSAAPPPHQPYRTRAATAAAAAAALQQQQQAEIVVVELLESSPDGSDSEESHHSRSLLEEDPSVVILSDDVGDGDEREHSNNPPAAAAAESSSPAKRKLRERGNSKKQNKSKRLRVTSSSSEDDQFSSARDLATSLTQQSKKPATATSDASPEPALMTEQQISNCRDAEQLKNNLRLCQQQLLQTEGKLEEIQRERVQEQQRRAIDIETLKETAKEEKWKQILEIVEEQLACTVCNDVVIKAVVIDCGHTFCSFCINEWGKKKRQCPYCTKPFQFKSRHFEIENFITKFYGSLNEDIAARRNLALAEREKKENSSVPDPADALAEQRRQQFHQQQQQQRPILPAPNPADDAMARFRLAMQALYNQNRQ